MKRQYLLFFIFYLLFSPVRAQPIRAQMTADSLALQEVVVTGTRNAVDVRHLPMTVTIIDRETLTQQHQTNILPTVMQQVPGLFEIGRAHV